MSLIGPSRQFAAEGEFRSLSEGSGHQLAAKIGHFGRERPEADRSGLACGDIAESGTGLGLNFRSLDLQNDVALRGRFSNGYAHIIRPFCSRCDACLLRIGGSQPLVHIGLCRIVFACISIRFPSRGVALWNRGGHLVRCRGLSLAI